MTTRYDVLGLGVTAVDELLSVADYPPADSKVRVQRRERHCGGLTATALVAAARLGSRCAYAGILGDDEPSRFVLACLEAEGIDTSRVARRPEARPVHATIVVEESRQTRTIFFDPRGCEGPRVDWPPAEVIRSSRVLFVDHYGVEGVLRAIEIAHAAAIPVVADLESAEHPRFGELWAAVDHLIVSHGCAMQMAGTEDPAVAVSRLGSPQRRAVVVTCGAAGCWYAGPEGQPQHQPAFAVAAIDTTGCGDVFHGAYASALARGLELADCIRLAAATAALKATRRGGQAGIPDLAAVEAFLSQG